MKVIEATSTALTVQRFVQVDRKRLLHHVKTKVNPMSRFFSLLLCTHISSARARVYAGVQSKHMHSQVERSQKGRTAVLFIIFTICYMTSIVLQVRSSI